ncbi:uncharacterized protein GGS22DRAFT_170252 [Annulohypoxylon maeteangense]|uniref:uncharacterized protein n=1 Tax=Annulohypoxylon maeteangense TaxID=1927788 RepID=UPI002008EB97|nr:uncharacterized protein GGS22DRAFT_170252 [Annulohypoxylon maeteangense]KAI0882114.1 hypothetical protein GGS22DRAFT_170252 [Annulohypoxylon maeteangense]
MRLDGEEDVEEWTKESYEYNNWAARLSEIPHRHVTLRIPYCNLCNMPIYFTRKNNEYENVDNVVFGIEGIEFEFNSILWKWLYLTDRKHALAVRLSTGFLNKPCSACVEKECLMRAGTSKFIETCNRKGA